MGNEKWEREGKVSNEEMGMMNWEEWGRIGRESKRRGKIQEEGVMLSISPWWVCLVSVCVCPVLE